MKKRISIFLAGVFFALLISYLFYTGLPLNAVKPSLELTESEKNFIKDHSRITLGLDPEYAPFEFLEDGKFQGMSLDYIRWIEDAVGLDIEIKSYSNFSDLLDAAFQQEVDMTGALIKTEERMPHMLFTDSFYSNYDIILIRTEQKPITEKELIKVRTAVIKGYSIGPYLRKKYPGIQLIEVDSITEGLKKLSFNEFDAFVTDFSQASYYLTKYGYQNINAVDEAKISYDSDLRFGVRKDYPELVSILNKAMDHMPTEVKKGIEEKWVGLKSKSLISRTTFYVITGTLVVLFFVVVIVIFLNRLLRREIESKTQQLKEELAYTHRVEADLQALNATLEEKVRQRTVELEELLEDFHATRDQMIQSEKMAFLGRLVAGVAHEINTPLGVVVTSGSYLNLLNKDLENEIKSHSVLDITVVKNYLDSTNEVVDAINRNVVRVSELVQSFKQLAIDQGKDSKKQFNLKENCDMVIGTLKHDTNQLEHLVINEIPSDFYIESYPIGFTLLLNQLILNALQHGFEVGQKGEVRIWVQASGKSMSLFVCDNGRGIPREIRDLVFDPFYTTTRHLGNSGLGLHIVYNVVYQQLGGRIILGTYNHGGTCYEIQIPDVVVY